MDSRNLKHPRPFKFARMDERGQGMVEFLFVAITFLFTILGIIQLAMALNAYSLVQYAAYNAARAGIVHNGSKERMQEAARLSLVATFPHHGRADHRRGFTENYLAALDTDQDDSLTHQGVPITDVKILHKDAYNCGNVVTFDDYLQSANSLLTVQVVHHYELVIPLVNRIVYSIYDRYVSGDPWAGEEDLLQISAQTDRERRGGEYQDIEYRIPLVATYTMRQQSDFVGDCG